jgi:DNA-binding NarL/FixJ family response regulator
MDSVRMASTVPCAELKIDGLLEGIPAPPFSDDTKPGGPRAGAAVYPDAEECLTFESAPPQSGTIHCGERFAKNRHVLWVREERIAVAIVDGDVETRSFLQRIMELSGGYRCLDCYVSGEEALCRIPDAHPRIVLMEVRLPGISGIECMRRLKARIPGLIVVLVSALTDLETMSAALAAGGDGYLTKPFAAAQCLATVRFSLRRDRSAPPEKAEVKEASKTRGEDCARLTDRENHVMSCLQQGLLYKEIADELHLSFSVVHKLQHRIFLKLRVSNRTEAVTKWRNQNGG